ncbi:MAG: ATP-grasp domain-containing protein [Candidatus Kerfeldbacteria bacterium]|nr:ATP-grasp domain-containing protein [Candidatus Kerfeldbacteria bacterium]
MKRILVTGAGGSACYNFIESLRDNNSGEKFYIVGTDVSRYHIELSNVDKRYIVPRVTEPRYFDVVNTIIEREKIDFLHCQPDIEVEVLSREKDRIHTRTLLPRPETVEICQDKMRFNTILRKNNLPVPEAYHITSENDLEKAMEALLRTNEKVWLRAIHGAGSRGAIPVKKLEHARMWIDYWHTMKDLSYGDFMVSEFLPGKEYAFQSVWRDGELLMSQARERVEYIFGNLTVSGQSSSPSVAVTVQNDEINATVSSVVKTIDPHATGIFCADLKTNKEGRIVLIEINAGRFFTTSFFFSSAGCNMPYYYTKIGLGENVVIPTQPFDNIPADWYWVRMIDMGYKLIKPGEWTSEDLSK